MIFLAADVDIYRLENMRGTEIQMERDDGQIAVYFVPDKLLERLNSLKGEESLRTKYNDLLQELEAIRGHKV